LSAGGVITAEQDVYVSIITTYEAVGGVYTGIPGLTAASGATHKSGFYHAGLGGFAVFTATHATAMSLVEMPQGSTITLAHPAGAGAGDVIEVNVIFYGYIDANPNAPALFSRLKRKGVNSIDQKQISDLTNSVGANLNLDALVAQAVAKAMKGITLLAAEPPSPPLKPSTSAAAGGELPLNKDEKSSAPRASTGGKQKAK